MVTAVTPSIVLVEWRDSHLASDGWTDREECINAAHEMLADPIRSAGFLIDDTDAGLIVASSLNQHADDVEGAIAIPRSAIVSLRRLGP